jgi:hypothetical protein
MMNHLRAEKQIVCVWGAHASSRSDLYLIYILQSTKITKSRQQTLTTFLGYPTCMYILETSKQIVGLWFSPSRLIQSIEGIKKAWFYDYNVT